MFCLQCGASNPGNAVRCASCNSLLEAVPAVVEQPLLRKTQAFWASISPGARATASLAVGIFGVILMRSATDLTTSALVLFSGFLVAALGILLGWTSLRAIRPHTDTIWCRSAACGGMLVSGGVALMPVAVAVGAIASIPKRMVSEPLGLSNMRRMSVALQSYAEDYGDHYPGWVRGADGQLYHNVWDQQLFPYVKYNSTFHTGAAGRGIRSPSQPFPRNRVLTVALNGLLITRPKERFDGNADWNGGAVPASPSSFSNPAATIVLAEVATRAPMGGMYGKVETPKEPGARTRGVEMRPYRRALVQWIDLDPRSWVETRGPEKSYIRGKWDAGRGVGRELHSGGAAYAFADGHVEYRKLRQTVTGGRSGLPSDQFWSPDNDGNMWNPYR